MLAALGVILIVLFVGITFLVYVFHVVPVEGETTNSQLARLVFGQSPLYYLVQGVTALILILAANTSFADFPRVASFLARDGFVPRQFANRGDRLAYSNGILILTVLSVSLLIVFQGETHALIPLYAVGVFLSFTLKQASMVRYWLRRRQPGWVSGVSVQAVGATATGLVMVIIAVTKFTHGAWIVVVLIPTLVVAFVTVRRHYDQVARQLSIDGATAEEPPLTAHSVLVLVGDVHRGVLRAIRYARALSEDARGVYVEITPEQTRRVEERWGRFAGGMPLVVLRSPYRSVAGPLLEYLDHLQRPAADQLRHDHPAGVHSGPLVAAPAPQPDRAPDQGRPALPEGGHRHERPVSPGAVAPMSVHNVKRILLGTPIPTAHAAHERLGPLTGLAIFASDALSSVAYATEEILLILMLAGSAALGLSVPIAVAIGALIAIVVSSYRQTILAYPRAAAPTSSRARISAATPASSPARRSWSTTCSRSP